MPKGLDADEAHRGLLRKFLSTPGNIVAHQVDSFNHFLQFDLGVVFASEADMVVRYPSGHIRMLRFYEPSVGFPRACDNGEGGRRILPSEIRARDDTYEAPLYCNVQETQISPPEEGGGDDTRTVITLDRHRVMLAKIPIMVGSSACNLKAAPPSGGGSGECPRDVGGYFIVKGRERVLISQVRGAYNVITVQRKKPGSAGGPGFVSLTRSMSDMTSHLVRHLPLR